MSNSIKETNNIGAISALKGYRVQFLYTLYRILSYKESESEFHPEGKFEDLDVYNSENEVAEVVQIKNLGKVLTLSDIVSSKKENSFLKRAIKAYNEGNSPIVKLVSFGEVNDDVKNLSNSSYSKGLIKKLTNQGLRQKDIEILQGNFEYEIVNEQNIKSEIELSIEKWGLFADIEITLDLLIYWIYYSAEKQNTILPIDFKNQFDKICKFQKDRVSFNKTFNSLIYPLDNNIGNEDTEHLKLDFYQGISATYKHVLADVDVVRKDKVELIQERFKKSNNVFIHGASGQGKSTLAYRFLKENCAATTIFELKHLPDNIATIYEVINSLESISSGIRFPITVYIDVEHGNKEWVHVLSELASKKNLNFLVTIREEDWNSIEVGDKFSFSEIELTFEQQEAELIYNALDDYNKDLRFINFNNAWEYFGGNGPLLEFVYLITQNESLSAKLKSQINNIKSDYSDTSKEKIRLLRYIVLADCNGSKVKLKEFNQFFKSSIEIPFLIELLQKEYLVKITGDKSHIIGLHPVRSKIIKSLLFDNEIYIEADFVLDSLSFISDNTTLAFLRNAFKYSALKPEKLIDKLNSFEPNSWQMYFLILKSLLWKGIADYTMNNIDNLNGIYNDYGKSWITVVNFDFAGLFEGGSIMENGSFFTEEQREYAKNMNQKFSNKKEVFQYCNSWLRHIKSIDIIPKGKDEWDSFGFFLFWLNHFNLNTISIDFSKFDFEGDLNIQPVGVIAHVLYSIKKYNSESVKYAELTEKIFTQNISELYSIISIAQDSNNIDCHYLFDIMDENFKIEETDILNAKSVEIINHLRFAFPDKDKYKAKGFGHKFSFLPNDYDSSLKEIPSNSLPFSPLVEINSTYINLFDYLHRPSSWASYVNDIINRRMLLVETLSKMTKAFNLYHSQKNLNPLAEYVHDYTVNYHPIIKKKAIPKLSQNIIDEWGEYGEGNFRKIKSSFDESDSLNEEKELKHNLATKKYSEFLSLYNDFDNGVENFLWQSAEFIFRKIKIHLKEDVSDISDNARISLVGNLFKAFEFVKRFQNEFRQHFEKFVDYKDLEKIEKAEVNNISILTVLYRQFIYSDSFISGNTSKIAIARIKDIESNIKKKIKNALKQTCKELNIKVEIDFDENSQQCVILLDIESAFNSFQVLEIVYNKIFEVLEQPEYTTIKYLILNSNYSTFNICMQITGKTINSTWYEFKTYNLREKRIDELEQFNLIPQKIQSEYIEKYSIKAWNEELPEFIDLDKFLECTSLAYQFLYNFSQLDYFDNMEIEEYNKNILQNHVNKIGELFQDNFQKSLDLYGKYASYCTNEKIDFTDDDERLELYELFTDNHSLFYPNDKFFEEKNLSFELESGLIKEWLPRLEKLVENTSIIYYFLAGKVIEKHNESQHP